MPLRALCLYSRGRYSHCAMHSPSFLGAFHSSDNLLLLLFGLWDRIREYRESTMGAEGRDGELYCGGVGLGLIVRTVGGSSYEHLHVTEEKMEARRAQAPFSGNTPKNG